MFPSDEHHYYFLCFLAGISVIALFGVGAFPFAYAAFLLCMCAIPKEAFDE